MKALSLAALVVALACACAARGRSVSRETVVAEASERGAVALCAVVGQTQRWPAGSFVVLAEVMVNFEEQIAFGSDCDEGRDSAFLLEVDQTRYPNGRSSDPIMSKRLRQLFTEGRKTAIVRARLEDPGSYIGHLACCRYRLVVEDVLAVSGR